MCVLICFGTRPEWLKVKPLIKLMKRNEYKLYFTGQHPDLLKDVSVDYRADQATGLANRLDHVMSSCQQFFPDDPEITSVLVQGDTASAFACALAAFHRQLKIYYLEAGLRTWDLRNPYPEEAYRQMIARIADVNFAPTTVSEYNLRREHVPGKIFVTGNTVLDNLEGTPTYGNKVLVTMHRRENHDIIDQWFMRIDKLAMEHPELEFILPIHPNPNVRMHRHLLPHVNVVEPMGHAELIEVLRNCRLVITDSGGLQEEGAFFNKRVIVCRKTTERPEGLETGHSIMCYEPADLPGWVERYLADYEVSEPCPYGDGNAAQKVYDAIIG